MPDLLLEIRISQGEPWRSIATGVWPAGGRLVLRQPTEPLRQERPREPQLWHARSPGQELDHYRDLLVSEIRTQPFHTSDGVVQPSRSALLP